MRNVDAVISKGLDLQTSSDGNDAKDQQVYTFNVAADSQVFVSFTGNKPRKRDDEPKFKVLVRLNTIEKEVAPIEEQNTLTEVEEA